MEEVEVWGYCLPLSAPPLWKVHRRGFYSNCSARELREFFFPFYMVVREFMAHGVRG